MIASSKVVKKQPNSKEDGNLSQKSKNIRSKVKKLTTRKEEIPLEV